MTLNEIIFDLRGIIRNNRLADDDRLDNRLLKEWVHTNRAVWIRRESSKGGWQVDRQIIQDIYCDLEVTDRSKVSGLTTGGSVLRTTQDIPKAIELKNKSGILEVGPVDRIALPFSFVTLNRARVFGNGRFNGKSICAFPYDSRIYLWANMSNESFYKYIRYIGMHILAEDPTEAARFKHVNGDTLYSDDLEYPMNSWMWKFLREEILEANFEALMKTPTDKNNDADDGNE
jgi:hypothetical protein